MLQKRGKLLAVFLSARNKKRKKKARIMLLCGQSDIRILRMHNNNFDLVFFSYVVPFDNFLELSLTGYLFRNGTNFVKVQS